jgi:membrane protein
MGMAAQIAYFMMLGLFPLLLFIISLLSFLPILEPDQVLANLSDAIPPASYELVANTIHSVLSQNDGAILGLGLLAALWSGSIGVGALITTINRAYNIHPKRNIAYQKLLAILLTILLSAFVLVSTFTILSGPDVTQLVFQKLGLPFSSSSFWMNMRLPLVLFSNLFAFSIVYYVAPEAKQRFVWILPGACTSTILWFGASSLFRIFVSNFGSYNITYGSIAAFIILIVWLWISGFIFLLGAEINALMRRMDHYEDLPRVKGRIRKRTH